ncbi:hypothetical protein LCGC14_1356300 [marine sediment metagenome]|uniref:Uncharacterized protein n=1 Tax=marine sediment metagenome TaxID=412755 RepID=A0A0F9K9E9_9ZZZZ
MGFGVSWERLTATLGIIPAPWIAKAAEELYSADIVTAATFYSTMVNWSNGKRLVIKVESSLDQAVQIQIIGNNVNSTTLATDINSPLPCEASGNISVGLAWDDWTPYVGVKITTAVAPTTGTLTITATVQE